MRKSCILVISQFEVRSKSTCKILHSLWFHLSLPSYFNCCKKEIQPHELQGNAICLRGFSKLVIQWNRNKSSKSVSPENDKILRSCDALLYTKVFHVLPLWVSFSVSLSSVFHFHLKIRPESYGDTFWFVSSLASIHFCMYYYSL